MDMKSANIDSFRKKVERVGILHARDMNALGFPKQYLRRLCEEGLLLKTGRGLYVAPGASKTAQLGLAQVAKAVPKSVICLLSALRFHGMGTQSPHEIWLALNRRAARPRLVYPKTRIVRFSGKALAEGIEKHDIAGVQVQIYNPAKTVADCFKYRNKIGLDVAIEALREGLRKRKVTMDSLWKFARICRQTKIMRPYMEAIQ